MQIIDLYIRGGEKFKGRGNFTTTTLTDPSASFLNGNYREGQIIEEFPNVFGRITSIVNSTTLNISGGAFSGNDKSYQVYDDYTKLDLFKDESVSITDSIQNVKDPSKIFAAFSQQFSVPASKNNNKFFKHYYNGKIQNSYDARYKGDALIQLNGLNYKIGKFRLTSVELKNNVAYSYKLVFTGESVDFKDILAQTELTGLIYPTGLNYDYTNSFVKSKFGDSATGEDLIFPLITHTKNMRYGYDSNVGYKDEITDTYLNFTDIKPALKCKVIIDAIENTYPSIKFSDTFFNTSNFKKLYMWLHREEGYLSNSDEGGGLRTISTRFNLPDTVETFDSDYNFTGSLTELRPARCYPVRDDRPFKYYGYKFTLDVQMVAQDREYEVQILRSSDNSVLFENRQGTGNETFIYNVTLSTYGETQVDVIVNIISTNTLGITQNLTVNFGYGYSSQEITFINRTGVYEKLPTGDENNITVNQQMPKMKVFDFLKNLFLMYNLTAFKEDGIINVLPLDDYYNTSKNYDITKYVDTSKSTVSKLLQFKNMIFNFKSKKSYLVQFSEELQGNIFAQESYGNKDWDGSSYSVEVGFEKMMYERLTNEIDGDLTTIVQGAMLDKKFEPTIGLPLLFYADGTTTTDVIKWNNLDGTFSDLTSYQRPSNSISNISTGFLAETLNFGIEVDEYTLGTGLVAQQGQSNDLFTKYYRNYVANLFNRNSRKLSVSAYLPLSIILKYRLNDIFVIGLTEYRINSIKTNLLTNKSDLELYNLNTTVEQENNGQSPSLPRVQNLETTSKTTTSIGVGWDNITDTNFERFEIYLDGEYRDFNLPGDLGYGFSGLDSDTTYKISIRPIYDINGIEFGAFDTDLFETTEKEPMAIAENGDTLITELSETVILE